MEPKLVHLLRRRHYGRRASVRGLVRVGQDFGLLVAVVNLARPAVQGVGHSSNSWTLAPAHSHQGNDTQPAQPATLPWTPSAGHHPE